MLQDCQCCIARALVAVALGLIYLSNYKAHQPVNKPSSSSSSSSSSLPALALNKPFLMVNPALCNASLNVPVIARIRFAMSTSPSGP